MNFPNIINSPCIPTTPPPPDARCGDPIFALLHPDICASSPFLRIKPGVLLGCVLGSVQFEAFTVQDGKETLISSGVTWSVSDPSVALIGISSGNATGITSGSVTVTALYQRLQATASLTVIPGMDCCSGNDVATMLVVDKSHSMSLQFGSGYATKQAFADFIASQYAAQTNTQKDKIGLIEFDDSPTTDASPTSDAGAVSNQAAGIINSVKKTGIGLALQAAVNELNLSSASTKVIVLISDGVDKDTDPDHDPVPIATAFKTAGGIMLTVGVRSHDAAFNLLNALSTGGFFVNAYPENVEASLNFVYGLKGYICAGNCTPPGNNYVNEPQLDYNGFQNWTVSGHVDLLGPGLFDVLPGNGLYVSLASNKAPWSGQLTSKTGFTFQAGKTYRLSFYLAGNQRQDLGTQNVTVQVGDGSQFQQIIIVPYFGQGFTKYSFNFTPVVTVIAPIIISQVGDDSDGNYFGSLFNRVLLEDITDIIVLFEDNFDGENLQYVKPACGSGIKISPGVPVVTNVTSGVNDPDAPGAVELFPTGDIPQMSSNTLPSGVASASSNNADAFKAFQDGNLWRSVFTNSSWIRYQFTAPQVFQVASINATTETFGVSGTCAIQGSNDGVSFTTLSSFTVNNSYGIRSFIFSNATPYLYFRLLFTLSGGSIVDVGASFQTQAWTKVGDQGIGYGAGGEAYNYAISYKTAAGETALSPTTTLFIGDYPGLGMATMLNLPGGVPPAVTQVRIWRAETVGVNPIRFYLLTTVAPATTTYTDILSHAQFQAILNPLILPPTSNTTGGGGGGGGSGDMTPGEVYEYELSYIATAGQTPVSTSVAHTVGLGASALLLTFPVTPPTVTVLQVWRRETVGALPSRFYLLAQLPVGTTSYVDTQSHATFSPDVNVFPPDGFSNGYGYFRYYGYSCYGYGCLSEPPGIQLPDSDPQPDIEADYVPPTTYTSTMSFTAKCPDGTVQRAISGTIGVAGQSAPFVNSSTQTGFAAAFTAVSVNVTPTANASGNVTIMVEGSSDGVNWTTLLTSNPYLPIANELANFVVPSPASYQFYRCTLTPTSSAVSATGTYTFELLSATGSGGITRSATMTSQISQGNADALALAAATEAANAALAEVGCATQYTSTQTATVKCPTGQYDGNNGLGSTQSATRTSFVSQADADALALAAAQAAAQTALSCANSNNSQAITINDFNGTPTAATPYPSVSYKSGLTGAITRIRVNLVNFTHTYPEDVAMVLISPVGKAVLLMLNCGGAVPIPAPINLTFDSNSVTALPDSTLIAAGTYKPTQYGLQFPFPAPVPANPYLTAFTTLIGDAPNGAWSLWICDTKSLDVGAVQGGWTLTLDTA